MTAGAHLLLVIVATTLAVAGVWAYWRQRVYGVAMDSVEAQLRGLDLDQLGYGPAGAGSTLVGDWGQAPTVARLSAVRPWSRGLAVEIIVKGAFPGLSARSRFNAPEAEAGRSLPVGDPAFDALALVQPEGYEVLVRLTRPTRATGTSCWRYPGPCSRRSARARRQAGGPACSSFRPRSAAHRLAWRTASSTSP